MDMNRKLRKSYLKRLSDRRIMFVSDFHTFTTKDGYKDKKYPKNTTFRTFNTETDTKKIITKLTI